jgi:hypothetical protein
MSPATQKTWLARLLIGLVFFFNIQCAIAFLVVPQLYAASFELSGPPGEGMLRGLGLLFLMWNVPYAVALWNPARQCTSLYEALAMQAIGVLGETLILLAFPAGHAAIHASIERFILFDGSGLALLVLAAWAASPRQNRNGKENLKNTSEN